LGLNAIVQGLFCGSEKRDAPVEANSLRHLPCVEVLLDGGVRRRADDLEGERNLVALDQLAYLLDCFWWAIGIVILDQIELAAVDATVVVDYPQNGCLRLADVA
jgi:hypothetical protein